MKNEDVIKLVLRSMSDDKLSLIDPLKRLNETWVEEAEKRLQAYRAGHLRGIQMDEIFGE